MLACSLLEVYISRGRFLADLATLEECSLLDKTRKAYSSRSNRLGTPRWVRKAVPQTIGEHAILDRQVLNGIKKAINFEVVPKELKRAQHSDGY